MYFIISLITVVELMYVHHSFLTYSIQNFSQTVFTFKNRYFLIWVQTQLLIKVCLQNITTEPKNQVISLSISMSLKVGCFVVSMYSASSNINQFCSTCMSFGWYSSVLFHFVLPFCNRILAKFLDFSLLAFE